MSIDLVESAVESFYARQTFSQALSDGVRALVEDELADQNQGRDQQLEAQQRRQVQLKEQQT